jgi:Carboxypeptidase regulatory-like domain
MLKFIAVHKLSRFSKQITASAMHSKINRTNANDSKGLFHMIRFKSAQLCAVSLVALLAAPAALHAQETTSAIRGTILNDGNAPISAATITLVHTPSGTRATATTDAAGVFEARGLRVGGPYSVSITANGFRPQEITEIFLTVAETFRLETQLAALAVEQDAIIVTASGLKKGSQLATGSATDFRADDIAGIVSTRRDIRDIVRKDPLANFDSNGGITIGGANTRFNRFSVDGVQLQDNFGLNNSGLPSSRGIISIEAIDQVGVKAAPFDISEGKFQGGSINVVLKSGTNAYKASAYGYYGDNSLASKGAAGPAFVIGPNGARVPGFSNFTFKNFGGFVSGPIIEDKLFIALNYERLDESRPNATGPEDGTNPNRVTGASTTLINQVSGIYDSTYKAGANGFNIGSLVTSTPEQDRKFSGRIDWNIVDGQRLALTYINHKNIIPVFAGGRLTTGSSTLTPNVSAAGAISLNSNWYDTSEKTKAYTAQLNSQWNDSLTSELRVSYRDYVRGQDSRLGLGLGEFLVCLAPTSADAIGTAPSLQCPTAGLYFGPDESRQSNALATKTWVYAANVQLRMGAHKFKLLAEYQSQKINNLFVQQTAGRYYFDSIAQFQARTANQVVYQNAITGNPQDAAANWNYGIYSVGLQDTYEIFDNLTLQYGLRYDWLQASKNIPLNQRFSSQYGFANNGTLNGKDVLQPRFGFNWKPVTGFEISGGVGLFGGGTPDVWVSNNYSNNGIVGNQVVIQRTATGFTNTNAAASPVSATLGQQVLNGVTGLIPSPLQAYLAGIPVRDAATGNVFSTAPVNALDPKFKLPSNWKYNLSARTKFDLGFLGDNWKFRADVLLTDVNNGLVWTDLRARPLATAGVNQVTPDGRQRFEGVVLGTTGVVGASTGTDILLSSASGGYSRTLSIGFSKEWDMGFSLSASYASQRAKDRGTAGAATAGSAYGITSVDGNFPEVGRSAFEVKHSGRLSVGYRKEFFGDNETRFEINAEIRSGVPFSYTFNQTGVFGLQGGNNRFAFFVPDFSQSQVAGSAPGRVQVGNVEFANQATFDALKTIVQNSALKDFQGAVAPRNLGTGPSFKKADIRVSQQIPFFLGKFTAFVDVENFLNLINKDWNSFRTYSDRVTLTNVSCIAAGTQSCARYLYNTAPGVSATGTAIPVASQFGTSLIQNQSLWALRLGLRYDF